MKNKDKFMKEIVALACNESSIAVEKSTGKSALKQPPIQLVLV